MAFELKPMRIAPAVDWWDEVPEDPDLFWRFESSCNFYAVTNKVTASIYLTAWHRVRDTPKGVWVENYGVRRWVSLNPGHFKRWAYATKQEAWESFTKRLAARRRYWDDEGARLEALSNAVAEHERNYNRPS